MNAEYFLDMLEALKRQGMDLSKVVIHGIVTNNDHLMCVATGTVYVNIGEDSVGTFTLEFECNPV